MKPKQIACGFLFLFSAIGFGAAVPEPSPDVRAILDRTGDFKKPNFPAVQALTEEERQLLLTYFREQNRVAHSREPLSDSPLDELIRRDVRQRAETALAMLADPEMMDRWLRNAKEAPAGSAELKPAMSSLALAAKPELVVEIAPFIMTGEPVTVTYVDDTRSDPSKNLIAGYVMLKIIERSPAFDAQTRKWAQDQTQADLRDVLKILPQWWKENEAHFVAKDYKAVKPGEDIYNPAMEKSRQQSAEMRAREAEVNAKKAAVAAAQTTLAAKTNPPKTERAEEKGTTVLTYVIIGSVVLALAGGLWLYSHSAPQ